MSKYTISYFIKKFEAIPPSKWCTHNFSDDYGKRCALGHCGVTLNKTTKEGNALWGLLEGVALINDGHWRVSGGNRKTPKGRILYALRNLQKTSKR